MNYTNAFSIRFDLFIRWLRFFFSKFYGNAIFLWIYPKVDAATTHAIYIRMAYRKHKVEVFSHGDWKKAHENVCRKSVRKKVKRILFFYQYRSSENSVRRDVGTGHVDLFPWEPNDSRVGRHRTKFHYYLEGLALVRRDRLRHWMNHWLSWN